MVNWMLFLICFHLYILYIFDTAGKEALKEEVGRSINLLARHIILMRRQEKGIEMQQLRRMKKKSW